MESRNIVAQVQIRWIATRTLTHADGALLREHGPKCGMTFADVAERVFDALEEMDALSRYRRIATADALFAAGWRLRRQTEAGDTIATEYFLRSNSLHLLFRDGILVDAQIETILSSAGRLVSLTSSDLEGIIPDVDLAE